MKLRVKLLILVLIVSMLSVQNIKAEAKLENRIIIIDEGHLQHYSLADFQSALSNINDAFDTSTVDYEFEIVVNEGDFNSSNLQGADLLIVSNPGVDEDFEANQAEYTTERGFIDVFVRNGGGVLYMGNPVSNNYTFSGHAQILNSLKVSGFGATLITGSSIADPDNTSVIIDDLHNDGNFSHIQLTGESIKSDILRTEVNSIQDIIYYGAAIEHNNAEIYGNTSMSAYPVGKEFEIVEGQIGRTKWMSAQEIGENGGRAMMVGSTIMFTNTSYDGTTDWIDVGDHRQLFENMLAWLANITPIDKPVESVNESFGSLFSKNLLFAIVITAAVIGLSLFQLIRKNLISKSEVLQVKVAKKGISKSSKSASDQASSEKTTKKQKARRKRN